MLGKGRAVWFAARKKLPFLDSGLRANPGGFIIGVSRNPNQLDVIIVGGGGHGPPPLSPGKGSWHHECGVEKG